jgi:hypothetical protein
MALAEYRSDLIGHVVRVMTWLSGKAHAGESHPYIKLLRQFENLVYVFNLLKKSLFVEVIWITGVYLAHSRIVIPDYENLAGHISLETLGVSLVALSK